MSQAVVATVVDADRWTTVEINLLRPGDWPILRAARLAALRDSPDAFVAFLEVEEERTPNEWIAGIESSSWVVARDGDDILSIARLVASGASDCKEYFIESVWVTPRHRREGLVRKMLWRLERQARAEGAACLNLWVLDTNFLAYDAYVKLDFYLVSDAEQDSWKPRGNEGFVQERLMVKQLL